MKTTQALPITKETAEALKGGADTILVPIDKKYTLAKVSTIKERLPIQVGDKFFCQEEFCADEKLIFYKVDVPKILQECKWQPASEMTEAQSRFNRVVVAIEIKRVQEITEDDAELMGIHHKGGDPLADTGDYNDSYWIIGEMKLSEDGMSWVNEFFEEFDEALESFLKAEIIDYEANPYVALYKIKEI
jgi:hypothetical protein